MPYTLGALYAVIGILHTLFSWDDEIEEWYGGLTVKGRYLFFAMGIFLWPVPLIRGILRKPARQARKEEEY